MAQRAKRIASLLAATFVFMPVIALAAELPAEQDMQKQLDALAARVAAQQAQIDAQQQQIAADQIEIRNLKARPLPFALLDSERAMGEPAPSAQQQTVGASLGAPKANIAERTQAVPQGQGVLTPAGRTTIQSSLTYIRSQNDRLVFAGIELVPGLQIGSIQASTADRSAVIDALTIWHGFSSRLEGEITIPALFRNDSIHLAQVRNGTVTEGFDLSRHAIGDIEGALRYQLNAPTKPDEPIFVAGLRVKSNTGVSPFSITYDEFGIAQGLATGSGFWGVQPGLTMLLPSDPVVIYAGVSYLYQIPRNINRTVGGTLIGRVTPGGTASANVGFGFSINPRFSFSLGYSHSYIFPTSTELNGSRQRSTSSTVGALDFGLSYRLSARSSVNLAFQFGVTQDAPNDSITVRIPFTF
jgi:hypothetical protein